MSSSINLQIISTSSSHHSPCILISTELQRFLFEVGEGTQRLLSEHKIKLGRLNSIFLSTNSITSYGGLPGLLLTLDEVKASNPIEVIGPYGASMYLKATRQFMKEYNSFTSFSYDDLEGKPSDFTYPSPNPLESSPLTSNEIYDESSDSISIPPYIQNDLSIYPIGFFSTPPSPSSTSPRYPDFLLHICKFPQITGKLSIEKAKELGVPLGPLCGKLKAGFSVTLPCGKIIHPSDVIGAPTLEKFILVIGNITSEKIIKDMKNSKKLSFLKNDSSTFPCVIVHMSSISVIKSKDYQEFLYQFSNNTDHVFIGEGCTTNFNNFSSFLSQKLFNFQLNSINKNFFPLFLQIQDNNDELFSNSSNSSFKLQILDENLPTPFADSNSDPTNLSRQSGPFFISPLPNSSYIIMPLKDRGWKKSKFVKDYTDNFVENYITEFKNENEERINAIKEYNQIIQNFQQNEEITSLSNSLNSSNLNSSLSSSHWYDNIRLFFLGTGCAIPSKYRNVSSFCLFLPFSSSVIMFDCGEGSWYQLLHLLPPTLTSNNSSNLINSNDYDLDFIKLEWAQLLKVLHISHPHADHHLGLLNILTSRYNIIKKYNKKFVPLVIIAPIPMYLFLKEIELNPLYSSLSDTYIFLSSSAFDPVTNCLDVKTLNFHIKNDKENPLTSRLNKNIYYNQVYADVKVNFNQNYFKNYEEVYDFLSIIGIDSVVNIPVVHCPYSYGVAISFKPFDSQDFTPIKLVYSGDTRPCEELIKYGMDAHILIHEATFESTSTKEAFAKDHTTILEARQVSSKMRAKHLILTHFSQRYQGLPQEFNFNLTPEVKEPEEQLTEEELINILSSKKKRFWVDSSPIGNEDKDLPSISLSDSLPIISFDFFTMKFSEADLLKKLTSSLAVIFPPKDEDEEDENENNNEEDKKKCKSNNKKNKALNKNKNNLDGLNSPPLKKSNSDSKI